MSCKVEAIIKLYQSRGRVVVSFDSGCFLHRLTVTKSGDRNIVGTHPGAKVTTATEAEIRATLEDLRMFIAGWKS